MASTQPSRVREHGAGRPAAHVGTRRWRRAESETRCSRWALRRTRRRRPRARESRTRARRSRTTSPVRATALSLVSMRVSGVMRRHYSKLHARVPNRLPWPDCRGSHHRARARYPSIPQEDTMRIDPHGRCSCSRPPRVSLRAARAREEGAGLRRHLHARKYQRLALRREQGRVGDRTPTSSKATPPTPTVPKAAKEAYAAFTGNAENIEHDAEVPREARQAFAAARAPARTHPLRSRRTTRQSVADIVKKRIKVETEQVEKLYGFDFQIDGKSVTTNEIDEMLRNDDEPRQAPRRVGDEQGSRQEPARTAWPSCRRSATRPCSRSGTRTTSTTRCPTTA